jgi:hypothetical protein
MKSAPVQREWFSVKSAAAYSDFSVSAIESAFRLGQLESRAVKIRGKRVARRIKREWIDAWIEGIPAPTIEEVHAGVTRFDAPAPVTTLAEQIAREVVRLLRDA